MKPAPFEYYAARSVAEAVELLARHGGEARVLAGGQSLVPMMNLRAARPAVLVDINRIPGLGGWRVEGARLATGALLRQRVLQHDTSLGQAAPLLAEAVGHIGHVPTRNRGTVGGSMAHADPSAELPVCAQVLDARMQARSKRGLREIEASDFFQGVFSTALAEDELLESITFAIPVAASGHAFAEATRRHGDFAMVVAAARLSLDADGRVSEARIALGGVGPMPARAREAEDVLRGQSPRADLWRAAGAEAARHIEPGSDIHATARYRRDVASVLVSRVLAKAAERAGKVPE